jgi:hypothetical protein
MSENLLPNIYPCPICHQLQCAHWIGYTPDRVTVIGLVPGRSVEPDQVLDTDILFAGGAMDRVYRRAYPKGARRKPSLEKLK